MRFILCFITLPCPLPSSVRISAAFGRLVFFLGNLSKPTKKKQTQTIFRQTLTFPHPHVLTFRGAALMHFQGAYTPLFARLSICRSRHVVCCWLCVPYTLTHIHFLSDPRYFLLHSFNGHSDSSRLCVCASTGRLSVFHCHCLPPFVLCLLCLTLCLYAC